MKLLLGVLLGALLPAIITAAVVTAFMSHSSLEWTHSIVCKAGYHLTYEEGPEVRINEHNSYARPIAFFCVDGRSTYEANATAIYALQFGVVFVPALLIFSVSLLLLRRALA